MIDPKEFEKYANFAETAKPANGSAPYPMDAYLEKHGFMVLRKKAWNSQKGGTIYELDQCVFDCAHNGGSASFTVSATGTPGYVCKHNACVDKTIKHVFAEFPADPGTVIAIRTGELPAATDEAEAVLLNHCERLGIFQRAGEIVSVVRLPEARKGEGLVRPAGTLMLQPMNAVALTETFERIAHFRRFKKKDGDATTETYPVDCPPRLAASYLARVGAWRVPTLVGTILTPIVRLDGSLLTRPGYDERTGLYLASDEEWPAIQDHPTREDAMAARAALEEPFAEFPFFAAEKNPNDQQGEHRSVHVAAIITAIERRILDACPLIGYSAPTQRSGKSLLAESVAIISTGKEAAASAASRDEEEFKKAILAALREGHAVINLDNVTHVLDSPDLARAITQAEYSDRILGETKKLYLPTNVLWTATGNNLAFKGDLTSRTLLCRINAGTEHPESRTFAIPNLKAYLLENRKRLVVAALTVLRAYHLDRRPKQALANWGGFDQWSDWIRSAIVWAGGVDPCKTRNEISSDDPETDDAAMVLTALYQQFGDEKFTVSEIAHIAMVRAETARGFGGSLLNPELHAALETIAGEKGNVNKHLLGWWFRRWRDRIVGDYRLARVNSERSGSAKWSVQATGRSEGS